MKAHFSALKNATTNPTLDRTLFQKIMFITIKTKVNMKWDEKIIQIGY